ncbi:hypothetical protein MC47_009845 [Citrobacter freundii]|nr:hypothetical protein MC47_009845 [Citrobacter freundii]
MVLPLDYVHYGILDTTPFIHPHDIGLRGGLKYIRQVCDNFAGLRLAEMSSSDQACPHELLTGI